MPYIGAEPDKGNFSDLNGGKLIIDADADTSITADTDDQIDIEIAGADDFSFKANKFEVQTGSNIDMNGTELILDADGDTSITADTDDQIDIKISGADDFQMTANTFTVLSGSTLAIASGATIANSGTATGFSSADPASADGDSLGTASAEWSDLYLADGGVIYFGNDQEITLTHSADSGLLLKHTATADDKPVNLVLQTGETDMAADDVIGKNKSGELWRCELRVVLQYLMHTDQFKLYWNGKEIAQEKQRKADWTYQMRPRPENIRGYRIHVDLKGDDLPRIGTNTIRVDLLKKDPKLVMPVRVADVEVVVEYLPGRNGLRDGEGGPG